MSKDYLDDYDYDVSNITDEDMQEIATNVWEYLVSDEAYQIAVDKAAQDFGLKKLYEEDFDEYYYVNEETENE